MNFQCFLRITIAGCLTFASDLFCTSTFADESYFRRAVAQMIKDSAVPAEGYAFTLNYSFVRMHQPSLTDTAKITLYTKGFDAYLKERSENTGGNPGFVEERLTIFNGWNIARVTRLEIPGKPARVTQESNVLLNNLGERCHIESYSVPRGEIDVNLFSVYEQPYQILVNPCLGASSIITPEYLLSVPDDKLVSLPNENGNKIFLVKNIVESTDPTEFIFHFSPENGDKLVKFEIKNQHIGQNVRYVDKWQKHTNGSLIAASICHEYDILDAGVPEGKRSFKVEYKVSDVKIGRIDARLFDVSKQPEFRQEWNVKVDHSKLPDDPDRVMRRDADYYLKKANGKRWLVVLVVNAVAIFLILLLLYLRRLKSKR